LNEYFRNTRAHGGALLVFFEEAAPRGRSFYRGCSFPWLANPTPIEGKWMSFFSPFIMKDEIKCDICDEPVCERCGGCACEENPCACDLMDEDDEP